MARSALRNGIVLAGLAVAVGLVLRALRGAPAPAFDHSTGPLVPPSGASANGLETTPDAPATVADPLPGLDEAPTHAPAEAALQPPDSEHLPAWVDPVGGSAPASHPVKAKLSSGIYHLPGMTNYERTTPDRCYLSSEAAEADGLRAAKR